MTIEELNRLDPARAREELLRCCGATRWAEAMVRARPFASRAELLEAADREWARMQRPDWLEAFSHHPRIGDVSKLRENFAATARWASDEQKGAAAASEETLERLARGNRDYEARFGHIFLICATGKSADEMLEALRARQANPPEAEIRIAAQEQAKITRLRLEKLLA